MTIMNRASLFAILFAVLFTLSCNRPKDLTSRDIYRILNEIIADNNIKLDVVCASMYRLPISEKWPPDFDSEDQTFIENQKDLFKNFKLEPHRLKSFWKRTGRFQDVIIDKSCKTGMLTKFSFPLISADRKKALLEIDEDCNCMLGGQEVKYLFINKNGHWKRTKSYDNLISYH